ncbi:MAG: hypothetical protein HKN22_04270 [Bacteroidia bacterium]|nr:hypothetical protein [Bacteroidia bacterium]
MRQLISICVIVVFVLGSSSCEKTKKYPDEPVITFESIYTKIGSNGKDSTLSIDFSFTDGDGNLGLRDSDLSPPFDPGSYYHNNFFGKYFKQINGVFVHDTLVKINGRIPYLNSGGNNKALTGDITYDILLLGLNTPGDTVKIEFFVVDRDLNHSNIITTPSIVVRTI